MDYTKIRRILRLGGNREARDYTKRFNSTLRFSIDVLVVNPVYVPVSPFETTSNAYE